jgi:hypothetical protein
LYLETKRGLGITNRKQQRNLASSNHMQLLVPMLSARRPTKY